MPTKGNARGSAPANLDATEDDLRILAALLQRRGAGTEHFEPTSAAMDIHDWMGARNTFVQDFDVETAKLIAALPFVSIILLQAIMRALQASDDVRAVLAQRPDARLLLTMTLPNPVFNEHLDPAVTVAFRKLRTMHGLIRHAVRTRSHDGIRSEERV